MKVRVPRLVLDDAREFFETAGAQGMEGTGMLAGIQRDGTCHISKFFAPDQIASSVGIGCSVEVTEEGKLELAASLSLDERYASRIHSHPGEAFHSAVDDRNPALTADGSFSIVVPYFGLGLRHGLEACAVYRRKDGRWVELRGDQVLSIFEVFDE